MEDISTKKNPELFQQQKITVVPLTLNAHLSKFKEFWHFAENKNFFLPSSGHLISPIQGVNPRSREGGKEILDKEGVGTFFRP